jgi:hypothetical protein
MDRHQCCGHGKMFWRQRGESDLNKQGEAHDLAVSPHIPRSSLIKGQGRGPVCESGPGSGTGAVPEASGVFRGLPGSPASVGPVTRSLRSSLVLG